MCARDSLVYVFIIYLYKKWSVNKLVIAIEQPSSVRQYFLLSWWCALWFLIYLRLLSFFPLTLSDEFLTGEVFFVLSAVKSASGRCCCSRCFFYYSRGFSSDLQRRLVVHERLNWGCSLVSVSTTSIAGLGVGRGVIHVWRSCQEDSLVRAAHHFGPRRTVCVPCRQPAVASLTFELSAWLKLGNDWMKVRVDWLKLEIDFEYGLRLVGPECRQRTVKVPDERQ